ncbi:DUF4405 domain-containing protein [Desulfovibrio inopinatus]|uniref:DUF4405 domain-containing protein n=1 Tax=Desulfovibrio inopinatus TaxID=102109 RepID=UPI000404CE49|nr:DUF4405 domain-containing protein [Desulfovibrio inopinatus]
MFRKTVSLLLALTLPFLVLSGLVVFATPADAVASWSGWGILFLTANQWSALFASLFLVFIIAAVLHLGLNWARLTERVKSDNTLFGRDFMIVAVILAYIILGVPLGLPPMAQFGSLRGFIEQSYADAYGVPPYVGAQSDSIAAVASRMNIDLDKAIGVLRVHNIHVPSSEWTLTEIAAQNGIAPGAVYETMSSASDTGEATAAGLPDDPPAGLGRMRLNEICTAYGLDCQAVLHKLTGANIAATGDMSLSQIAASNNLSTFDIYQALREDVPSVRGNPGEKNDIILDDNDSADNTGGTPPETAEPPIPTQTAEPAPPTAIVPAEQDVPPAGQQSAPTELDTMMLADFARQSGIALSEMQARLAKAGITAFGDMTFREVALENAKTVDDIYAIVMTEQ